MRNAFSKAYIPMDMLFKKRENTVNKLVVYYRVCSSMEFRWVERIFYFPMFITTFIYLFVWFNIKWNSCVSSSLPTSPHPNSGNFLWLLRHIHLDIVGERFQNISLVRGSTLLYCLEANQWKTAMEVTTHLLSVYLLQEKHYL